MRTRDRFLSLAALGAAALFPEVAPAQRAFGPFDGHPAAIVDLSMREGVALVGGEWKAAEGRIVEVDHRSPGPDLRPSGPPNRTHDVVPHAGAADFDDSGWETIDPTTLEARRSTGRLCFEWYRIGITIPEQIGAFDPTGSSVLFEIVVDDYAEVWVNGALPLLLGRTGGSLVAGWNAPNRVVVGRNVRPGDRFQIAVFAANGPLSEPPGNFIWIRSATLEFHGARKADPRLSGLGTIERLDPALDAVVPPAARIEKIAEGFEFTEGPVWHPDGYLLFSDPNANKIWRWTPDGELSVFRAKSGYKGIDAGEYGQPGSNGLALDREGRLTICEHGNHRVTRLEKNGVLTVLADRYEGKRLNSPNDLVFRSDGALYFSDPPFGLPRFHDDPRRESPYTGVYCLVGGALRLVSNDLTGPNGLVFSPDEKFLYVTNWDPAKKVVMRYEAAPDGTLSNGRVFFDMGAAPESEALDGIEADAQGNLFVSGPGGVWVLSPDGRHLGTIRCPELPANFAWGDADGGALYMTARTGLYRMRLRGAVPAEASAPAPRPAAAPAFERLDPRFDALVPPGAAFETVAEGFAWLEGPAWSRKEKVLYFSDIPKNSIFRWREGSRAELFLRPSGYSGSEPFRGREPGSNGLTFDPEGRLVICEHGDRRIARLEADGKRTVLADRYEGKRLNSPNDVLFGPNGDLYFTDPPFGLPGGFDDPGREIPFGGVYRRSKEGALTLLAKELRGPNGLAFSPDGKTLYVSDADPQRPLWMAYPVRDDGTVGPGRVFCDARPFTKSGPGFPDGMEVDRAGNLFGAGPGGVYVFAPDGTHLGTLRTGVATSNLEWGGDGSDLYVTADTRVLRIRLATRGF